MRLPGPSLKPVNLAVGSLYFHDGSQKALAAFICWLALLLASDSPTVDEGDFYHAQVITLVSSLLQIRTVFKASVGQGDEIDSAISRIVKQNVDSKVQPVSSLTWASILATLGEGTSLGAAIARYNQHPEVQAFEGGGVGSISLDGRKRQAGIELIGCQAFVVARCNVFFCFGLRSGATPSALSIPSILSYEMRSNALPHIM